MGLVRPTCIFMHLHVYIEFLEVHLYTRQVYINSFFFVFACVEPAHLKIFESVWFKLNKNKIVYYFVKVFRPNIFYRSIANENFRNYTNLQVAISIRKICFNYN